MANKPKNSNNKKENSELRKSISNNVERGLSGAEGKLALKSASFASRKGVEEGDLFRFDDFPESKAEVDKMFSDFLSDVDGFIKAQQKKVFSKANARLDKLETNISKFYNGRKHIPTQFASNEDALRAFQKRIDPNGLNISKRLWRLEPEYRKKVEDAITAGLQKGQGPVALANRVTKYLREFEGDKPLPKAARSKKNCHYAAYRLAYTEINMAYRTAEQERYKQMEDVVGMRIKTSEKSHKEADLCDVLAGDYPKSFKWTGWHPLCHCYLVPIFRTKREHDGGEEGTDAVKRVPANYTKWVEDNAANIAAASQRRKLPYFLADNKETWQGVVKDKHEADVLRRVLRGDNASLSVGGGHKGNSSLAGELGGKRGKKDELSKVEFAPFKLTQEQKGNIDEIAKELEIEVGRPMTFSEADGFSPNSDSWSANRKGFDNNCQSCVIAFELRARGLNVKAKAYNSENKLQKALSYDMSKGYLQSGSMKPISMEFDSIDKFMKTLSSDKDGGVLAHDGRYIVGWDDKVNQKANGHVIVGIVKNGVMKLYDPQNGGLWTLDDIASVCSESQFVKPKLEILRVDDKGINAAIALACVRGA